MKYTVNTKKILVVDDDPVLRKTLCDILQNKNYEPIAASTGREALEITGEERPAVALIDLRLGDVSGLDVMREIKERCPAMECIVLTGYATQKSAIEAINLGAYSYFQKPYNIEQLLVTIRRGIEKLEADMALQKAYDELETRVKERTADLLKSYEKLKAEIAERMRFQEALEQSEEKYRTILENIEDGYFELDLAGNFTFFNNSVCRILEYTSDELTAMRRGQYPDQENLNKIYQTLDQVHNTGKPIKRSCWDFEGSNGSRKYVEVSISPIKNASGEKIGFRGVIRDITEHMQIEEALNSAKAAEESNKMKDAFLANISHELRTPMNGIIGFVGLVLDTELTVQQRDYLELVRTSADSLMLIINNILDISRIEAGHKDLEEIDFDLRTIIETTASTFSLEAHEKGLELACHIDSEVPSHLTGDPERLRQIIVNLVGNAIKFTGSGGGVLISCEGQNRDQESVLLHFCVYDTGIGIAEDKLDVIFNRFTQADDSFTRKYGGTGLGLSISRHLTRMMEGRIWVESPADCGLKESKTGGPGSAFHFTARFGLQTEKEPSAYESKPVGLQGARVDESQIRKLKALVVDDNRVGQLLAVSLLEKHGHSAVVAVNGEDALEALKKYNFDIVLMDVQMPEVDGIETTRIIRNSKSSTLDPHVPIIAVTAHAMRGDRERFLKVGMDDYLSKPLAEDKLFEVIGRFIPVKAVKRKKAMESTRPGDVINWTQALARLGGDEGVLKKIQSAFVEDAPSQMEAFIKALETNDAAVAERQAHSLKGAAANIGAASMQDEAFRMELALRKGDLNRARGIRDQLEHELRRVITALSGSTQVNRL